VWREKGGGRALTCGRWCGGRLYFAERNVPGMLEVLRPMHQMMQRGAVTKREMQFQQQLGRFDPPPPVLIGHASSQPPY